MISAQDIILYSKQSCPAKLLEQIHIIAERIHKTWQPHKSLVQITSDITREKIAKLTLKNHITSHSNYTLLDYDEFRIDAHKKHAPLDCILFQKEDTRLDIATQAICFDFANVFSKALSSSTRQLLRKLEFSTMKIKTTPITSRHKNGGKLDDKKLLEGEFLVHPHFYKKTPLHTQINSWQEYLSHCIDEKILNSHTHLAALKVIELENMYDYEARVYVDILGENLFDVYLIGYISKEVFMDKAIFKQVTQNKAQRFLYLATALKNAHAFKKLEFALP